MGKEGYLMSKRSKKVNVGAIATVVGVVAATAGFVGGFFAGKSALFHGFTGSRRKGFGKFDPFGFGCGLGDGDYGDYGDFGDYEECSDFGEFPDDCCGEDYQGPRCYCKCGNDTEKESRTSTNMEDAMKATIANADSKDAEEFWREIDAMNKAAETTGDITPDEEATPKEEK